MSSTCMSSSNDELASREAKERFRSTLVTIAVPAGLIAGYWFGGVYGMAIACGIMALVCAIFVLCFVMALFGVIGKGMGGR